MKTTFKMVLLAGVAAVAFAAHNPAQAAGKHLTILASMPQPSPFFVHMNDAIKAEAAKLGDIDLIEVNGQDSTTKQTADVEAAISKGVDGIIISPREVDAMAPALKEAVDAKIPVVTIDRRVDKVEGILAHVGADNVLGGEAQGQLVEKMFPNGAKIINLQGIPGSSPAIDRNKGLHNVVDKAKDKYQIVFEQTANFARDQGLSITESALAAMKSPPDFIVAANDDMALGAMEAVKGRGLAGKVGIVGYDSLPEALKNIKDGTLTATIEQFPGGQSSKAVDILVSFLRDGKKPEKAVTFLTPIAVTKDNLNKAERLNEIK